MKGNEQLEWKEAQSVLSLILTLLVPVALVVGLISLAYFLPLGIVIGFYFLACLAGTAAVVWIDHIPHPHRPPPLPRHDSLQTKTPRTGAMTHFHHQ